MERTSEIRFGYADFIRLCRADNPESWEPGLVVKTDGLWVNTPQDEDQVTFEEARKNVLLFNVLRLEHFYPTCERPGIKKLDG